MSTVPFHRIQNRKERGTKKINKILWRNASLGTHPIVQGMRTQSSLKNCNMKERESIKSTKEINDTDAKCIWLLNQQSQEHWF